MAIKLMVGLANPGAAYKDTRHNAGAWIIEKIIEQENLSWRFEKKLQGQIVEFSQVKLFIPSTFMNHSGIAVQAVSKFYQIAVKEMLVAHDELDLSPGIIKLKAGGGHGGHNGLRNIIQHLGCADFYRLRIGIGHPGNKDQVLNYVLKPPAQTDKLAINTAIDKALILLPLMLTGDFAKAMNRLH